MRSLDLIGAIELAYDRTQDETKWLSEVLRTIAPAYGANLGLVASFVFDFGDDALHVGATSSLGGAPYEKRHVEQAHEAGMSTRTVPMTVAYECDPYTLLSRVVGPDIAKHSIVSTGVVGEDVLGLRANATPTSGVLTMAIAPTRGHRIRNRDLWTRFASHLGTALRLRRTGRPLVPDTAPAVLTPGGRLEHGSERTVENRAALSDAAKAIDKA